MEIRKSTLKDLETLCKMYENARRFMACHGNPGQWGKNYPSRSLIESDIRSGCSYVCVEHNRIIGTYYYRQGPDDAYLRIYNGKWINEAPYGVVHRITSDQTVRGTASFCLQWAFKQCGNLKIDTHRDNYIMQHMLEKNGFKYCGVIYLEDGSERIAYQKAE